MALYRQLQTSFWRDGFVIELTPEEKYFYLYLMSNSNTHQCGIYELPRRIIECDTGYNKETVEKLLKRFIEYGKILYSEETKEIFILNWIKYNFVRSKNTIACINKELKEVKNREFIERYFNVCSSLGLPVDEIFKDINIDFHKEHVGDLEGACKGLCKQKEEKIKEKEQQKENKKEEKQLGVVVEMFNNNIHLISPIEYERIVDWCDDMDCSVVIMAIKEAVNQGVRTMKYINSILNRWKGEGIKTEEGVIAYQREWLKKKKKHNKVSKGSANAAAFKTLD